MRAVRWISAHLETPIEAAQVRERFWSHITGTALGNDVDQTGSRPFLPENGAPYLGSRTTHGHLSTVEVQLHAKSLPALLADAGRAGGRVVDVLGASAIVRSPGGLLWRAVVWSGQKRIPAPVKVSPSLFEGHAVATRADQIALTVPASRFEEEVEYWSTLLGWKVIDAAYPAYVMLVGKDMPMRILLRRDTMIDAGDGIEANLDVAGGGATDAERLIAWHRTLGASSTGRHPWWITMTDPTGCGYNLTRRDPVTGAIRAH